MSRFWRRLALVLVAGASIAVLNLTPAFAQGGYGGGGYMPGAGSMPYQAPMQGGGSGYRPAPSYQPSSPMYKPSSTQRGMFVLLRIRRGDTLTGIARRFGVPMAAILRANPFIRNPDVIYAGQTLVIPLAGNKAMYEGVTAGGYGSPAGGYGQPMAPQGGYAAATPGMPTMMMPPMVIGPQVPMVPPVVMPAPGAQTVTVNLAARNLAFNMSTITAPAGAMVVVNFDNQDSGVAHNFAVYTDSSAQQAIFQGQTITGPGMTTYTFMAPSQPGTYFFRCDVHFTMMTGQFVVS